MKKIFSLLAIMLVAVTAMLGQQPAPGILNYQGVARNSVGNVLINKTISLRLTIRDGSAAGPTVYSETRTVTTNPFGLFNVQLGSPGFTAQTGTIAGVPWGVGAKFIQVEIDPNGGSSFINIGTAQLASVPYSLYASQANDLVLPFNKTQSDAGTLFKITNSGTGSGSTALEGLTNSTAGNAYAITGTVTSTAPGGFSTGVRGINNGNGGLGIGVWGSQNGNGYGVYGTTPQGWAVRGESNTGVGVFGSSGTGAGVHGMSNTGNAGLFEVTNTASTADALRATTAGTGASWAIRGISSGTNGAGLFQQTNASNTANNLQSNQAGLGRAGLFNATNAANTAAALEASHAGTSGSISAILGTITSTTPGGFSAAVRGVNNGTGGLGIGVWGSQAGSGWGVYGTAIGGIGVNASANSGIGVNGSSNTGTGGRFTSTSGLALHSTGGVRLDGIGEANNFILRSDAAGNATWVDPALILPGSFLWTRTGTNTWATNLGDNVGVGTNAPGYKLDVVHGGATGIHIGSTASFSVVDLDAANGDAALRYQSAGTTRWNVRNAPGSNDYQIIRNNSLPANVTINNGTGFVGITQTAPSYQLDVLHAGSTGIRSQSNSGFSVVDIDAASGDAALRFANAGVNQWNVRNRPADDYFEIFELGGGGSRVVIQDGTGNVGIGATTSPSYKLDVEHGGATGARILSTSSFSVVDIDAASGDAALRFAKAGVNQWNVRNRPADDYFEIFELGGGGSRVVIQDGTGNVGIGATTSPSYKLDVEHGGFTGIRSRSTSSFSVVDIDADNGDAALRFAKAGVNQWNTRNRPADDYYEIFELGGGGSRFVIQDGTGNVGIGATTSPSYKLDVEHGGATGARILSTSSFSVVDIDAASGDAALRYAKAGVNQWNVRNNPGTDDYQIFELGGGGERLRIENTTGRVVIGTDLHVTGTLSKGGGAFKIDHPMDPDNKYLVHSFVESPEMMNIYNGNITTDASGKMTVQLPDYFNSLNKDFRYQLTVIGSFAQAIISKEVNGNSFEIATSQPNVKVSWQVTGVRQDPWANKYRIPNVVEKASKDKGMYLNPELFNQPESRRIGYTPEPIESSLNDPKPVQVKAAPPTTGGSLDQAPVVPPAKQAIDNSGSVENVQAAKTAPKTLPVDGSVAPQVTPEKKAEVKPVDVKGTSLDDKAKPVENKKVVSGVESTKGI